MRAQAHACAIADREMCFAAQIGERCATPNGVALIEATGGVCPAFVI